MAEALLVAVGKGSQADVGPKPVTEDCCAVLRAPVFGAARAGMVAVRMRYEVDCGLSPRIDVKGVVGPDESPRLKPYHVRHAVPSGALPQT
jgi:hypothetical protein